MSSFNPNPMLAAQMISYAKGQENQTRFSGEKSEKERKDRIVAQQAEKLKEQQKTANLKEGILA